MKVGAIILCRLDSSRLPGKALLKVKDRPLLDYVLSLCRKVDGIDTIALATSDRPVDDPLSDFAESEGIESIRGSLNDVAQRFLQAMKALDLDAAVRVNGDSPLINPKLMSECVRRFRMGDLDLVSNVPQRTYPFGMSVEVVGRKAMERSYAQINNKEHREHVTKYFYDNQRQFEMSLVTSGNANFSGVQLAVDTPKDFRRFSWIVDQLKCDPTDSEIEMLVELARTFSTGRVDRQKGGLI